MNGLEKKPRVLIVVAVARNGVIGKNNTLPWHLPEDLAHFKRTTLGKPVIMGRNTFESIVARLGKPLPGRRNIVITRNPAWQYQGAERAASLDEALALCGDVNSDAAEVCVIGGAQLYAAALEIADEIVLTQINQNFDGDAFFAPINPTIWRETSRTAYPSASITHEIVVYQRCTA